MVTFVSLFLSLISGLHTVEVAVDGPVARVDIVLDQRVVRVMNGPPWRTKCNFGDELEPHELIAVAYDAAGVELDRARQLVNLPRPSAEARVAFESDERGRPIAARVYWESADPVQPLSVFAIFDGVVLQPEADGRYPLPPYDINEVHIVSAEVRFVDGITARSDVTFGSRYGTQVATELTAIPIRVDDQPPNTPELAGAFKLGTQTLVPVAVERLGFKVFLVRDQTAVGSMLHIRSRQDSFGGNVHLPNTGFATDDLTREQDRLHFVIANPDVRRDRFLYPTTQAISLRRWTLRWLVTHLYHPEASVKGQRLADAVAVASVQAASEGTPRAVVVVLSDTPDDNSVYAPQEVRSYLRSLRVPLFVWHTGSQPPAGWGESWGIESARDMKRAEKAVRRELKRQWIVWVEGNHMVNQVELYESASGFRLAGN